MFTVDVFPVIPLILYRDSGLKQILSFARSGLTWVNTGE